MLTVTNSHVLMQGYTVSQRTGLAIQELRFGGQQLNLYLPVHMLVAAMVFEAAQSHMTYQKL